MDRKAAKPGKYQGPDSTTILLVENDDIALMNECKMLDAIREAYPRGLPGGVDEIWFVHTPTQGKPLFRFHDGYQRSGLVNLMTTSMPMSVKRPFDG